MITIGFTEAQKQALHYERFHHPHPRVQRKMEALWLKSQKLPHRESPRDYPDFSQFKAAISDFIEQAHLTHKQELDSLLTLRFQTFNKSQIMTV